VLWGGYRFQTGGEREKEFNAARDCRLQNLTEPRVGGKKLSDAQSGKRVVRVTQAESPLQN